MEWQTGVSVIIYTVPNNSFGFWADLHLDGHV
jgi:hypothetical protein